MTPINERLLDEAFHHAVDLAQYGTGVVRRMLAILNRVDADLMAQLSVALEGIDPTSFTVERLEAVLGSVRALNLQAYQRVERALTDELRDFAAVEYGYQQQLLPSVGVPVRASFVQVAPAQVYAAAMSRPFQGRLLKEWAAGIEEQRMVRIRDAVRVGFIEGETNSQIIRRIRGTREARYQDGIIELDRRQAETIVRTAVQHTAAAAQEQMEGENADLLKAIKWSATLDARTSPICRVRDGKLFTPKDHKPIGHKLPWLAGPGRAHFRCRSARVMVLKPFEELTGISGYEPPARLRAAMDGKEAGDTTYGSWLARQSAARQDEILGPTRGALMRNGGMPMDSFYTERGVYLGLDELRKRNAAAFKRAGV